MKKVPSALKWLAEKRARVSGQLQASQQVLELVSAQVESLEKELAAMKAVQEHCAAKVAQHTGELACLEGSVVIYDESIDPKEIGTIRGWAGRYGKRGALREFLFQVLKSRAPEYVSTSELALLAMAEFSLVFEHWKLRKHWYTQSLRNALVGLEQQGRIERSPARSRRQLSRRRSSGRSGPRSCWRNERHVMQLQRAETVDVRPQAAPRHAQVVPSFIVPALARTIECWVGSVNPGELVRWERPADLTESARRELRTFIIKRLRPRSEWLWAQPTGVRLAEGWRERVVGSDKRGIEAVLVRHPGRQLEELTLGEFRRAFGGPLERQLAVLARLEALYWTPPPRPAQRPRVFVAPQSAAPVPPGDVHEVAQRVLALPWLAKVSPFDLRFGYPGTGTLPEWLREQLLEELVPAYTVALLQRLDESSRMTAADEVRALTAAGGQECLPRMNPEAAERWPGMFLARHLSPQGTGKTLVEVGDANGLTRERVRQICEAYEDVFQRSEAVTPALDRVLSAVARIAPCGVDEANEQLARFIGDGAGIESLLAWTQVLGRQDVSIRCNRVRRRLRGKLVDTTVVERADALPWLKPLIDHVSRDTSMFGCTNILRVAGLLALKEGVAPGQEAIEAALEGSNVFRWLDKETGWFALGETDGSSVATRVRKIMAVAHDHVGADEIAGALASDDMLIYRETQSLGLAVPPVHVLRELFRGWPWLKVVQKGRFAAGEGFEPAGVLSEAEQLAVHVIEQHEGVACRFELREAIAAKLHLTNVAVSAMLGSSPIFARLEHGLYRLIGRRVGDAAVNAARTRMRMKAALHVPAPLVSSHPNEFAFRVTEAALKNEQYSVPTRFHPQLAGKRVPFWNGAGRPVGEARISQSGALSGFNRIFMPKPGDLFRVAVDEQGLRVELLPAEADGAPHSDHP